MKKMGLIRNKSLSNIEQKKGLKYIFKHVASNTESESFGKSSKSQFRERDINTPRKAVAFHFVSLRCKWGKSRAQY